MAEVISNSVGFRYSNRRIVARELDGTRMDVTYKAPYCCPRLATSVKTPIPTADAVLRGYRKAGPPESETSMSSLL